MTFKRKKASDAHPVKAVMQFPTEAVIRCLQGNLDSDTLMVVPPPRQEPELQTGSVWSGRDAFIFFKTLQQVELQPDDFLLMPTVFWACRKNRSPHAPVKVLKDNGDWAKYVFSQLVALPQIKRVVVVGSAAFKLFIGDGKMPPMNMLSGKTLKVPSTLQKPLMVLEDTDPLNFQDDMVFEVKRDYYIALKAYKAALKALGHRSARLRRFMDDKPC